MSAGDARRARDEGLSLVARTNRWIIGGAITLAAALTGLTAHSFHVKTAGTPGATATPAPQAAEPPATGDDPAPLQSPSSAPAPAPQAPAPAPVASGGS